MDVPPAWGWRAANLRFLLSGRFPRPPRLSDAKLNGASRSAGVDELLHWYDRQESPGAGATASSQAGPGSVGGRHDRGQRPSAALDQHAVARLAACRPPAVRATGPAWERPAAHHP